MRGLLKIAEVDVIPLLNALAVKPHLWNQNSLRTTFPGSPHAECDDIWLWFSPIPDDAVASVVDEKEVIPYAAWAELPQARPLVFDLMRRTESVRLGRCMITRLPPGKSIPEHVDMGAPAEFYTRYQVALQNLPGSVMHVGDETANFLMGEVWLIDNNSPHSVVNNSADDRIVLIIDLRHS